MSRSQILSIIGALGATASVIAAQVGAINPKWGAILTIVGLALTTFNARAQGDK